MFSTNDNDTASGSRISISEDTIRDSISNILNDSNKHHKKEGNTEVMQRFASQAMDLIWHQIFPSQEYTEDK